VDAAGDAYVAGATESPNFPTKNAIYTNISGVSIQHVGGAGNWYHHVEILGSGGNAITALVVSNSDEHRGSFFAVKIFKRLTEPKRRERFLRESAFLKECAHPSIMRIVDSGNYQYNWDHTDFDYPFVVAEYLPKTLGDVIREGGVLLPEKVSYMLQILSALVYLHERKNPVIHRDIKPNNLFVKGGSCVLGDFGLLKVLGSDEKTDPKFYRDSLENRVPWLYRSPELVEYAKGNANLTPASDIFQLGLVAAELFGGRVPINTPKKSLDSVFVEAMPHIHGSFGKGIAMLIQKMLEYNPKARPTAVQLIKSWESIFWDTVDSTHQIEGHAFRNRI
jgi:serine/threonine-protein kinase